MREKNFPLASERIPRALLAQAINLVEAHAVGVFTTLRAA